MDPASGIGLPFIFCLSIFFFINPSLSVRICKPAFCSEMEIGPQIRFPFRLKGKHGQPCGYPGFDLSCNNYSQTILTLPHPGDFVVNWINYTARTIYINDPDFCLSKRIADFNVVGSPFRLSLNYNYTFFNCSSGWTTSSGIHAVGLLICRSDLTLNYTILATLEDYSLRKIPQSCRVIPNVSLPLRLAYTWYGTGATGPYVGQDLELVWEEPAGCRSCEQEGLFCGFKSDSGAEVGCARLPRTGLPISAKYGVIIGVCMPGLVCLIGLACYTYGKVTDWRQLRRLNNEQSTAHEMNPPPSSATVTGLDAPTIESLPKTVIGESRRLPKPNDGTCPICLSEYQPKETLRSIPECKHYFHAGCVDEWLKLNGTCPLCRNSLESNSMTPCSSMSSTFSTFSA
ncbi:hypothetical protein ACH5RR_041719 [Cinchona calisaya]|uniref:RING-type E3 ubiquitin transferase n=1 Tax=Cinchona calisaya TaxID=153742 RepID=A0ABD2XUC6_9GENT